MNNKYDLIVVGGGFAGVAAAISAAREGESVLLIEKYNCLGGAAANYAIDIHNPEGTGTRWHEFEAGQWYEIPYRCMIPKGMSNLLVAGRCISSTHEAQSSYRIMPYCCALGQVAGVAASVANKNKTSTRNVDIVKVQEILRREGFEI